MRLFNFDPQHDLARQTPRPKGRFVARIGLIAVATLGGVAAPVGSAPQLGAHIAVGVQWIVEAEDSVCGVQKARQIRKPAMVRFEELVKLTPESKKIKRERIDPDSAEGIRLMNLAKSRVRDASAVIMKRQGYDSVWKRISSRKGTHIEDVTAYVEIEMANSKHAGVAGGP